jgi:ketosteroid isomerase-like protein
MRRDIPGRCGPCVGRSSCLPLVIALVLIFSAFPIPAASAQPDISDEEAAILALLNEESKLAVAGDLDGLLDLYVQDDKNTRLSVTKTVSAMITGWDAIRGHQENLLESSWMDWEDKRFSKENVLIKVHGDDAWSVCDNVWTWREGDIRKQFQNIQITILEKHGGEWKIAFQAFIRDPEHMEIVDLPSE